MLFKQRANDGNILNVHQQMYDKEDGTSVYIYIYAQWNICHENEVMSFVTTWWEYYKRSLFLVKQKQYPLYLIMWNLKKDNINEYIYKKQKQTYHHIEKQTYGY